MADYYGTIDNRSSAVLVFIGSYHLKMSTSCSRQRTHYLQLTDDILLRNVHPSLHLTDDILRSVHPESTFNRRHTMLCSPRVYI